MSKYLRKSNICVHLNHFEKESLSHTPLKDTYDFHNAQTILNVQ